MYLERLWAEGGGSSSSGNPGSTLGSEGSLPTGPAPSLSPDDMPSCGEDPGAVAGGSGQPRQGSVPAPFPAPLFVHCGKEDGGLPDGPGPSQGDCPEGVPMQVLEEVVASQASAWHIQFC